MSSRRVLVTGASGLLGREVMSALRENASWTVEGWCFSRSGNNLRRVDLCQPDEVQAAFDSFQPHLVVHCAAERRPDAIGSDPNRAAALNAAATALLALLLRDSAVVNPLFLYLSTDYVFDGTQPPYAEDAQPNPLNEYGRLKLEGERKVESRLGNSGWAILRVPILYGPAERAGEGAVDALVHVLKDPKPARMDNLQQRYPTHTQDVAAAILFLLRQHDHSPGSVFGIYHFSGAELTTKYAMVRDLGDALQLPVHHVTPVNTPPPASAVQRPHDAHLQNNRLAQLGFHPTLRSFKDQCGSLYAKLE